MLIVRDVRFRGQDTYCDVVLGITSKVVQCRLGYKAGTEKKNLSTNVSSELKEDWTYLSPY